MVWNLCPSILHILLLLVPPMINYFLAFSTLSTNWTYNCLESLQQLDFPRRLFPQSIAQWQHCQWYKAPNQVLHHFPKNSLHCKLLEWTSPFKTIKSLTTKLSTIPTIWYFSACSHSNHSLNTQLLDSDFYQLFDFPDILVSQLMAIFTTFAAVP